MLFQDGTDYDDPIISELTLICNEKVLLMIRVCMFKAQVKRMESENLGFNVRGCSFKNQHCSWTKL